ncbi:MAG: D-alanyl-D-alanine carboxypeptidase [Olsenella sp.]|nr:D-alanyl-D-alanine carboxypeptidase [Olsenella sp.]MCH3957552.1 D-alanyl-D-alanine carboxypeptidase [Olsenella sp.]MCI1646018.1 D-alanyl-D-alanine carboxypeptidase [Olsenella sp.]MCI1667659.1 D-alanyl-D-alanine carboxypeptidase [Olsenella sp.]MCI1793334.1 D-alanyl-D-alanine carboxypeptidase [Olsenella sp.]
MTSGPKVPFAVALVACLLALLLPQLARGDEDSLSGPVLSEAQCAIVEDSAGNVLYEKNADKQMPMASITKVMTAMVALDSGIDLDTRCQIHATNLGADSQTAGFVEGDTPTLRELLRVMLVYSANDAAENVALNVAGSEDAFVELMNEKAQELGMTSTHFVNPHGLDEDGHYSTVSDLALMGRVALSEYPFIASTVHTHSVTVSVAGTQKTFYSTDELLGTYRGIRGIKTGYVAGSAAFLGACQRNGVELFTCVLGAQTSSGRFADTATLLDWAYANFKRVSVASDSWVVGVRPYAYNFAMSCAVMPIGDETAAMWPEGGSLSFSTTMLQRNLVVDNGQPVGSTTWTQDGRSAGSVHYAARLSLANIPRVNVFTLPLYGYAA